MQLATASVAITLPSYYHLVAFPARAYLQAAINLLPASSCSSNPSSFAFTVASVEAALGSTIVSLLVGSFAASSNSSSSSAAASTTFAYYFVEDRPSDLQASTLPFRSSHWALLG